MKNMIFFTFVLLSFSASCKVMAMEDDLKEVLSKFVKTYGEGKDLGSQPTDERSREERKKASRRASLWNIGIDVDSTNFPVSRRKTEEEQKNDLDLMRLEYGLAILSRFSYGRPYIPDYRY